MPLKTRAHRLVGAVIAAGIVAVALSGGGVEATFDVGTGTLSAG